MKKEIKNLKLELHFPKVCPVCKEYLGRDKKRLIHDDYEWLEDKILITCPECGEDIEEHKRFLVTDEMKVNISMTAVLIGTGIGFVAGICLMTA